MLVKYVEMPLIPLLTTDGTTDPKVNLTTIIYDAKIFRKPCDTYIQMLSH